MHAANPAWSTTAVFTVMVCAYAFGVGVGWLLRHNADQEDGGELHEGFPDE